MTSIGQPWRGPLGFPERKPPQAKLTWYRGRGSEGRREMSEAGDGTEVAAASQTRLLWAVWMFPEGPQGATVSQERLLRYCLELRDVMNLRARKWEKRWLSDSFYEDSLAFCAFRGCWFSLSTDEDGRAPAVPHVSSGAWGPCGALFEPRLVAAAMLSATAVPTQPFRQEVGLPGPALGTLAARFHPLATPHSLRWHHALVNRADSRHLTNQMRKPPLRLLDSGDEAC